MVHLSSESSQLFQEYFLGMLRSLSLNEAHHFASLLQVETGPVTNVHFKDVFLRQLDLGSGQEFDVFFI